MGDFKIADAIWLVVIIILIWVFGIKVALIGAAAWAVTKYAMGSGKTGSFEDKFVESM